MPSTPLRLGDHVRVEASQDSEAYLTATDISIDKSAAADDTPDPETTASAKTRPASPPVIYKPANQIPKMKGRPDCGMVNRTRP